MKKNEKILGELIIVLLIIVSLSHAALISDNVNTDVKLSGDHKDKDDQKDRDDHEDKDDNSCWIDEQKIIHPEVNHTVYHAEVNHTVLVPEVNHTVEHPEVTRIVVHGDVTHTQTVIDSESYTELIIDNESYTETVVDAIAYIETIIHPEINHSVYNAEVNHSVFHPEINHTITIVDIPENTTIVVDQEAYTTPAELSWWHISVPLFDEACEEGTEGCHQDVITQAIPEDSVWMKGGNHNENEHPCSANDESKGCHDDGYDESYQEWVISGHIEHISCGWFCDSEYWVDTSHYEARTRHITIMMSGNKHHADETYCQNGDHNGCHKDIITPEIPAVMSTWHKTIYGNAGCAPWVSGCHRDIINPEVYHPEVNHTVYNAEVNHTEVIVDYKAWTEIVIDVPASTTIVVDKDASVESISHAEENHTVYHAEVNHTVYHAEVNHTITIIDIPAWDETIVDTEAWTEIVVDSVAHTDIVVDSVAHTDIVVDSRGYTEIIEGYYDQECLDNRDDKDDDDDEEDDHNGDWCDRHPNRCDDDEIDPTPTPTHSPTPTPTPTPISEPCPEGTITNEDGSCTINVIGGPTDNLIGIDDPIDPIAPEVPVKRGTNGGGFWLFGVSDCNRVDIMEQMFPTGNITYDLHIKYNLENIYWGRGYWNITGFKNECIRYNYAFGSTNYSFKDQNGYSFKDTNGSSYWSVIPTDHFGEE